MSDLRIFEEASQGLCSLPPGNYAISREGYRVDISSDIWNLPYSLYPSAKVNFEKISSVVLRRVTQKYILEKLVTTSAHSAFTAFSSLCAEFFSPYQEILTDNLESSLVECFEKMLGCARSRHRLWAMYRPIQWFIWCAENYPECGFSIEYAS